MLHTIDCSARQRVRLWLEPDGCPVLDTTSAIAARKRAKLLGKDQGRHDDHTVSGVVSACLMRAAGPGTAIKSNKTAGKQVTTFAAVDPLDTAVASARVHSSLLMLALVLKL